MHYTQETQGVEWERVRKKPVVVHACQLTEDSTVETMEGVMNGKAGDFLMKGIAGEVYICDREIFFKTYDLEW
jgi:hypothetical protein